MNFESPKLRATPAVRDWGRSDREESQPRGGIRRGGARSKQEPQEENVPRACSTYPSLLGEA